MTALVRFQFFYAHIIWPDSKHSYFLRREFYYGAFICYKTSFWTHKSYNVSKKVVKVNHADHLVRYDMRMR